MTRPRTSPFARSSRPGRHCVVAVLIGAGIALTPLPASANTGATAPGAVAAAPAPAPTHAAQVAVDTALAQVGKPYEWGGAGPNSFDCSGLMVYAYRAAGITLPRTSQAQAGAGVGVSTAALQPGDLLIFYSDHSHVGMYIGNGQMVHSSTAGQPVKVVDLKYMPGLALARRVA